MQLLYNIVMFVTVFLLIITFIGILCVIINKNNTKKLFHIKSLYLNIFLIYIVSILLVILFENIFKQITFCYILTIISFCCYLIVFHGVLERTSLKFKIIFITLVIFFAINCIMERVLQWSLLGYVLKCS